MHARHSLRSLVSFALTATAGLLPLCASAQNYTFTRIADASGAFRTFSPNPAINEMGTVVFCGTLDAGGEGIYISDGSTLRLVAGTAGSELGSFPVINYNNTVAYLEGRNILLWKGGAPTSVYTVPDADSFSISLNDNDEVACWQRNGIVRGNGGGLTTLADTSGPFSFLHIFGILNNYGVASFSARRDAGGSGVYLSNGSTLTTVVESSGNIEKFGGVTAVNDYGNVAYKVYYTGGEEALYVTINGVPTLVADTYGAYAQFLDFALNSNGEVVFSAILDNGLMGIFAGDDPSLDAVILEGDSLDGRTVDMSAWVDRGGFNNRGQVVFHVFFEDQTQAIYRADPVDMAPVRYDPNTDGRPDMLLNNPTSGQVAYWTLKGNQVLEGRLLNTTLPANWQVRSAGDFNGDQKPEILLQNIATGQVMFWFVTGTTVTGSRALNVGLPVNWLIAGVGDINQDGRNDIVLCNPTTGQVGFWLMAGMTMKEGRLASTTLPANWQVVGVGRFDADAHLDLALFNATTGQVALWYLNGTQVRTGALVNLLLPAHWTVAGVGDTDLDGNTDLTLQNTATGQVAYWYMRGKQVLSTRFIGATLPANWRASGPR